MADLTIGEVNKVLRLNLTFLDETQTPNINLPLDLTGATAIQLFWVITNPQAKPEVPSKNVNMSVVGSPTLGVVQYIFVANDLVKPPEMGKEGAFRYTVKVTWGDGSILNSSFDGKLTIKDDSVL